MSREIIQGLTFRNSHRTFDVAKLNKLLENAYLEHRRENAFKTKKSFAPSGLGYGNGTCGRYWYHAFNGADFVEDMDALAIAGMESGTQAHTRIQTLLKESNILNVEEQKIIHDDPPIFGFLDALIQWQGEEVVCEIKTTRQEMFLFRKNTMQAPFYNLLQILIYMEVLKKKRGFLLYENKNSQEFLIIPVEMDEENQKIVDRAFEWMRMVHKNALEGELPTRPFPTKRNKVCRGCPVKDWCWDENPEGTISLPLLEIK